MKITFQSIEFGEAINVGSNLESIKPAFLIFVLESCLINVQDEKFKQQREAIDGCIKLWQRDDIGSEEFAAAEAAAWATAGAVTEAAVYTKFADKLLELMRGCK